jgi:hypothetical protein
LILHILEFFDMLHEFIFNFFTYIHAWMSIDIKLILKYKYFVINNQKNNFEWWYLYALATSTYILNPEYRVSNKSMISPRHST